MGGGGEGSLGAMARTLPHPTRLGHLLMIVWGITSEGHKKEYYFQ